MKNKKGSKILKLRAKILKLLREKNILKNVLGERMTSYKSKDNIKEVVRKKEGK